MKMSTLMTMLAALAAATIAAPVTAHADSPAPCSDGQVQVSNGGQQAASGHRELVLVFSLAPGAQECSLTGYPGVDSGAGGPLIHASRTMAGFMGGLRDTEVPPTVPVTATAPARAVVEGVAVDKTDANRACPKYTQLLVTAPDTTTSGPTGAFRRARLPMGFVPGHSRAAARLLTTITSGAPIESAGTTSRPSSSRRPSVLTKSSPTRLIFATMPPPFALDRAPSTYRVRVRPYVSNGVGNAHVAFATSGSARTRASTSS